MSNIAVQDLLDLLKQSPCLAEVKTDALLARVRTQFRRLFKHQSCLVNMCLLLTKILRSGILLQNHQQAIGIFVIHDQFFQTWRFLGFCEVPARAKAGHLVPNKTQSYTRVRVPLVLLLRYIANFKIVC